MHTTGPRALGSSSAATALVSRLAPSSQRAFHASHRLRNTPESGPGAGPSPEDGKPQGKSENEKGGVQDKNNDRQPESVFEQPTRRLKSSPFAPSRQRPVRSRVSDDLPPVKLPQAFLDNNVSPFDSATRYNVLANDPIWHRGYVGAQWHDWLWNDLETVFDQASWGKEDLQRALQELGSGRFDDVVSRRCATLGETAQWMNMCLGDMWSPVFTQPFEESEVPKELSIKFLEAKAESAIVSAILAPDRRVDSGRPTLASKDKREHVSGDDAFLRGHIQNHILHDSNTPKVSEENTTAPEAPEDARLSLEDHGSRIFDPRLLGEITTALRADFALKLADVSARKELKRPLLVVNIPNYSGTYPSRRLFQRVATHVGADLVQMDAQDLASVVGGYLGQDTAFAKGSMSMLAYRTAEMNGRLTKGVESSASSEDDMSSEIEAAWVNIRQHASGGSYKSPMEEELSKIKEGAKDYVLPSVDRWENLKISAALERMIHAAVAKSSDSSRPLIVHVDNFVELNMTLEGAVLLGRLRNIVDGLWRDGKQIVLVGSSASEDPSEQFTSTVGELAAEECLVTFPLRYQRIPNSEAKRDRREAMDFLQENVRNFQLMSRALGDVSGSKASHFSEFFERSDLAPAFLDAIENADLDLLDFPLGLADSTLPSADIYHLTRLCHGHQLDNSPDANPIDTFLDVVKSRIPLPQSSHASSESDKSLPNPNKSQNTSKQKAEPERLQVSGKYNEFEKKLLTGLVDANEIRTTFSDVHAPPETISALKLLTSLSLVRPEAFSYGVLATDRIPGCLLYGPPGTGKTLLAKAVAKESGASMLEVSGASINDMYVGQSEKNVRALFSLAKKLSPLVIFIDEADALFAARGQSRSRPSHRETINQFLREWDGINDAKAFIMVATNRPFDLDDAVLRRLPRKILVDLPLQADRAAILRIHLKDERLDPSVAIDQIAKRSVLYSGSDLKNLCVAAAMAAVQEELEEATRHAGPVPYVYPERRTLAQRHFDRASREIAASISEDMDSLKSIRQFDQKYGDHRSRSRKQKAMGFGVIPGSTDSEDARVRQPLPAL